MEEARPPYVRWLVTGSFWLLVVCGVYVLVSALVISQATGLLVVSVSKSEAQISISAANKNAAIIGTGAARARLKPGTYQLVAFSNGSQTTKIIKISKKQTVHTSLNLNDTGVIRSPANVNYQNMSALISSGLTTNQVSALEEYFFLFKPSDNKVTIATDSVEPGPHNPNTATSFTLNFDVVVGSAPYKATATYSDLNTIRLRLYDPKTNVLVYDSMSAAPDSD